MNKLEKLQKNIDDKVLTIKHIGSRGEGVSSLTTEINYIESHYTFFIPFTLPDEIVVVRPTFSNSEGVRANLVEIKSPSPKRVDPKCEHFFQCGGCLLQHWNFEDYSCWKVSKVSLPILKISPGFGGRLNNSHIIVATSYELKLSLTCFPLYPKIKYFFL